jgi:cellulose synthase (UDP-forming)
MQRLGYNTAYINEIQAAGLATESLSAHVGQRIRWARGMAQIFRTDNPFLGVGLTLWQRICYANAMLHFFFGLPRLVFLTAPMAYLFFELHIINAQAIMLALYVVPYILQANLANAHIQGKFRHSFWAEVYETVLAWYVALPTTVALINPKLGKFNVTAKGGLVANPYFDWMISRPNAVLAGLNFLALVMGLLRLMFWNSDEPATVALNLFWTVYNLLVLGAALGVASESRQVRSMHRVVTRLPATLYLFDGSVMRAECIDFSMTGVGLEVSPLVNVPVGDQVQVGLWMGEEERTFPARVMPGKARGMMGLEFLALTREQQIALVQCTFARPDAWQDWGDKQAEDKPLQGLREIAQLGLSTYQRLGEGLWQIIREQHPFKRRQAT